MKTSNALPSRSADKPFIAPSPRGIIRKKLRERDGIDIPDPHTLFEHLIAQGYDSIHCLTTHVIAGIEYEQLCADAAQFPQVHMARPLLWSESDYDACVHAVMHTIPARRENEALLLMGHGTEHFANAAYCELEHKFRTEAMPTSMSAP